MKTFGLTGGIGTGKSTVADLLQQWQVAWLDTDLVARHVVEPGQPALREIQRVFGDEVMDVGGQLRRGWLADKVFGDARNRQALEAILHPRIREVWERTIQSWTSSGLDRGVVVIPLLFEVGLAREFDVTVCVACSAARQRARMAGRGWTEQQIAQRLAAQWPLERKLALADRVIWNDGSREVLAEQARRIFLRDPADQRS